MESILLTGAHGFIGQHLTDLLKKHYHLHFYNRLKPYRLPQVDIVIHLGARTKKSAGQETEEEKKAYHLHNVVATKRLLALLARHLPSYVLYISTMDVDKRPITAYAQSKLHAEQLVSSWCTTHAIAFSIVRLGNVYGPGDEAYQKSIPVFVKQAVLGIPMKVIGDGSTKKTYLYVKDAARIIKRLIQTKKTGIHTLKGNETMTITKLVATIHKLIHHTKARTKNQRNLATTIRHAHKKYSTIIFDLDGPLLNHWKRMYRLYATYLRTHHRTPMSFSRYEQTKKYGASEKHMVNGVLPTTDISSYMRWKKGQIEMACNLRYDTLQPSVRYTLQKLRASYTLTLVTGRYNKKTLIHQLKQHSLLEFFDHIITKKKEETKIDQVIRYQKEIGFEPTRTWIVGDTEEEIQAANACHIHSISVTNGTRCRTFLSTYQTTSISSLKKLLDGKNNPLDLR